MAAVFKDTVQRKKNYLEETMARMRLANSKELRDIGVIDDEELKEEERKKI
jgi:hypothetical protein